MKANLFQDRTDAGQRLAVELAVRHLAEPYILALPRGGVPVAVEIAKAIHAPMDVIVVRKVGAPGHPEVAAAAVVEGEPEHVALNMPVLLSLGLDREDIADSIARETREVRERASMYRSGRPRPRMEGKSVIVVDDGLATGTTVRAVIESLREDHPESIGVAVPVAPPETLEEIARLADWTLCLSVPDDFTAVGAYYIRFPQVSSQEVIESLTGIQASQPREPQASRRHAASGF